MIMMIIISSKALLKGTICLVVFPNPFLAAATFSQGFTSKRKNYDIMNL
jgi:hypothetical protein